MTDSIPMTFGLVPRGGRERAAAVLAAFVRRDVSHNVSQRSDDVIADAVEAQGFGILANNCDDAVGVAAVYRYLDNEWAELGSAYVEDALRTAGLQGVEFAALIVQMILADLPVQGFFAVTAAKDAAASEATLAKLGFRGAPIPDDLRQVLPPKGCAAIDAGEKNFWLLTEDRYDIPLDHIADGGGIVQVVHHKRADVKISVTLAFFAWLEVPNDVFIKELRALAKSYRDKANRKGSNT